MEKEEEKERKRAAVNAEVQVTAPLSKEEQAGRGLLELISTMGLGSTININQFFNIKNYSSHASDTEEVLVYKRHQRQQLKEKEEESNKRRDLEREVAVLHDKITQLEMK